jgi:hypothetical protein
VPSVSTSKAPIAKRQHTLPQMVLRRFVDGKGRIFYLNKRASTKGVLSTKNLKNLFLETHIYSSVAKDGTKNAALETYFSGIEGKANLVIEKIVSAARTSRLPQLSSAEKDVWDIFVPHLVALSRFSSTVTHILEF